MFGLIALLGLFEMFVCSVMVACQLLLSIYMSQTRLHVINVLAYKP